MTQQDVTIEEVQRLRKELEASEKQNARLRKDRDDARAETNAEKRENAALRATVVQQAEQLRNVQLELDMEQRLTTSLSDRIHSLERTVEAFRNGAKFENLRRSYEADAAKHRSTIKKLREELAAADRAMITMRNNWIGVLEDYERQLDRERRDRERERQQEEKRREKSRCREERDREKLRKAHENARRTKKELEQAEQKIAKLERSANLDHTNSGRTSHQCETSRGKIANSREKTGRKPGAQPGHKGYGRRRIDPTDTVLLKAPEEIAGSADWMLTGRQKKRQVIGLRMEITATDYIAQEYENIHTGKRYFPPFPAEAVNDVNYAETLKAALLYLTHHCCVSIEKARQFMCDLSRDRLHVSHGFIESLPRQFTQRTMDRMEEIHSSLAAAPYLHADFTVGWVNGQRVAVGVCSDGSQHVIYRMSERKGHEAAKLLPIEDVRVLVSDREATLLNNYGVYHQVCLEHLRRDLNDILQNDPKRKWAQQMKDLLEDLRVQARNWDGRGLPKEERREYERQYDRILDLGKREYDTKPASPALPQGPTLLTALRNLKQCVLYFLRHPWIPPDNSEAERRIRVFKRKQHQCTTFRSTAGIVDACNFLSVITTARLQSRNVFDELLAIFAPA